MVENADDMATAANEEEEKAADETEESAEASTPAGEAAAPGGGRGRGRGRGRGGRGQSIIEFYVPFSATIEHFQREINRFWYEVFKQICSF